MSGAVEKGLTRRRLVELAALAPAAALLAPGRSLGATAACAPPLVEQTAGPYYRPGAPARRSLLGPGVVGDRLVLTGRVLTRDCRPVTGTELDFWQADGDGAYDLDGYRLRGVQRTDRLGRYRLVTVVPGRYPGRTEHIHVIVRPPRGRERTTQLYFPGSSENATDGIFDRRMTVRRFRRDAGGGWTARFDFVL
ncbi:MAG: intradiol ring-cleavage dioxygenase [Gaiella sp.]